MWTFIKKSVRTAITNTKNRPSSLNFPQMVIWNMSIFSKNWLNWVILIFRCYGEGKKKFSVSLFYHLNMQCLTSVFYPSSFSPLFWEHYYWGVLPRAYTSAHISLYQVKKCFGYVHCTLNYTLMLSISFGNASGFWIHCSTLLYCVWVGRFCLEFSFGLTHVMLHWRSDLMEMQRASMNSVIT